MIRVGIRDLKNNLSRYMRRVAGGERIIVTDHGRAVAEISPPALNALFPNAAPGLTGRPPLEDGTLEGWPSVKIKLPPGTAAKLIDEDRGES
jgi:prevent-host-death family protein